MSARKSRPSGPAGTISASKIRLVKTAVRQLKIEETDYRALLQRTAGVKSSTALTLDAFDAVMAELHRLGFQYQPSARRPKAASPGTAPGRPTDRQWRLLEDRARLVGYTGLEDPRFIAWLRPRGGVEHPRFLDMQSMQRALGALGNWIKNRSTPKTTLPKGQPV